MNEPRERRNFDEMPVDSTRPGEIPATPTQNNGPGWAIPMIVGAVVLVAGLMIFNAAGPDRTQTAGVNSPTTTQPTTQSQPATPPLKDDSSAPPATPAPQKSNPAGTQ
jgi:hypothetical protein